MREDAHGGKRESSHREVCHLGFLSSSVFLFLSLDETDVVGSDYRCFVRGPSRR